MGHVNCLAAWNTILQFISYHSTQWNTVWLMPEWGANVYLHLWYSQTFVTLQKEIATTTTASGRKDKIILVHFQTEDGRPLKVEGLEAHHVSNRSICHCSDWPSLHFLFSLCFAKMPLNGWSTYSWCSFTSYFTKYLPINSSELL